MASKDLTLYLLVNSAVDLEILFKNILFSILVAFSGEVVWDTARLLSAIYFVYSVHFFSSSYISSQPSRVRAWFSASHVLSSRGLLFFFGNCSRIP